MKKLFEEPIMNVIKIQEIEAIADVQLPPSMDIEDDDEDWD